MVRSSPDRPRGLESPDNAQQAVASVPPNAPPARPAVPWRIDGDRPRDSRLGRKRTRLVEVALAIALAVAALLVAIYRFDPSALGVESNSPGIQPPSPIQMLTNTGDTWLIPDSTPHVVNFTWPVSGELWTNFTVTGGAVAFYVCPASVVIEPMGSPPCDGGGVFSHAHGTYLEWSDSVVFPAKIAFINYGPSSQSSATVTLVWDSPLAVTSGPSGA